MCDKEEEEIKKALEENIVRKLSDKCRPYLKTRIGGMLIGVLLVFIHSFIMICSGIVLVFSNNIFYLLCLLIFITADACSIVVLHDCPLTKLEQKYMKRSIRSSSTKKMKNSKIVYKCGHDYEKQLEFLINMSSLVIAKMFCIICLKMFNISINID